MNSYERIFGTIKGEPVDRVPVSGVLCMYGARLTGCRLEEYYTNPHRYIEGQMAVVERFEPDFLLSPLCVANEGKAFGCEIRYFEYNPPNISKRAVTELRELSGLRMPNLDEDPSLLYTRETIRGLSKQYKGQIPLGAVWMDPLDMLANAIGPDLFVELMLFHPSLFNDAMGRFTEFCIQYGNTLLHDGADLLINFASLCNSAMITKDMAVKYAKPVLEKTYEGIEGAVLFHHGGYKITPFLKLYKSLPKLLGFVIDSKESLVTARSEAGSGMLLGGNIEGPTLDKRLPEQINLHCQRMLALMEEDGGYMLCSSAADIPYRTEEAQIDALMKAPRKRAKGEL